VIWRPGWARLMPAMEIARPLRRGRIGVRRRIRLVPGTKRPACKHTASSWLVLRLVGGRAGGVLRPAPAAVAGGGPTLPSAIWPGQGRRRTSCTERGTSATSVATTMTVLTTRSH
jgi:hypothetical protein